MSVMMAFVVMKAFISVYFNEISPDFFEIWDPEDPSKGEFHIRYYTVNAPEGKEKIRYNIWGGPVEGNPVSADIFEAIQLGVSWRIKRCRN